MLETLHSNTPYILVHEGDAEHGGASLDLLRAECERNVDEEGVAERIFDGETPIIPWLRLREYQVGRSARDQRDIERELLTWTPARRRRTSASSHQYHGIV